MWATVTVPSGIRRVSLYFMNKDGHDFANRYRNYLIEIKDHQTSLEVSMDAPTLAHARVVNFWGGVYHRFIVCGPATYDIRVSKNGSLNAIVSAVLLDRLEGKQERTKMVHDPWLSSVRYQPAAMPTDAEINAAASPELLKASMTIYSDLDSVWDRPDLAPLQYADRLEAYRALSDKKLSPALLENWRWKIHMWTSADRDKFLGTVKSQWAAVLAANPKLATFPDR